MKYSYILLLGLTCLLSACNNHSEEGLYTKLNIVRELEPQSSVINWANMTPEERKQYPRKGFVINSANDYPNEPNINMTDLKLMGIDFKKYTLLVNYSLIPGYIKGHRLRWFYDNTMKEYEFQSSFSIVYPEDYSDEQMDLFTYYRSAILVDKIKPDVKVIFTYSY